MNLMMMMMMTMVTDRWLMMDEWLCIIIVIVNVIGIIEMKLILCRYQPPVLAISSLYWKAWTVLLILAAFNPASFGMLFQLPFIHFKYVSSQFSCTTVCSLIRMFLLGQPVFWLAVQELGCLIRYYVPARGH